jgi:hypothetical protein
MLLLVVLDFVTTPVEGKSTSKFLQWSQTFAMSIYIYISKLMQNGERLLAVEMFYAEVINDRRAMG